MCVDTGGIMSAQLPNARPMRNLSLQVVETGSGVILRRGCSELKISGHDAAAVVRSVLSFLHVPRTAEEILSLFPVRDEGAVRQLLDRLRQARFLVFADEEIPHVTNTEQAVEIFYWHFGEREDAVTARLNSERIAVAGVNTISRRIAESLTAAGVRNLAIIDHPPLRNVRMFESSGNLDVREWPSGIPTPVEYDKWRSAEAPTCLVATSDFGGLQLMREWNEFCIENNAIFLPAVLQNMIGYVGPLVVPRVTACFECLRARQNANLLDPEEERVTEYHADEGQFVTGYHPAMASTVADVASFELTKFYAKLYPVMRVGHLIEINLMSSTMKARKVLRVPRCSACSPLLQQPSVSIRRELFVGIGRET
jgi:molybdopterin-synthase adenylyltransferase